MKIATIAFAAALAVVGVSACGGGSSSSPLSPSSSTSSSAAQPGTPSASSSPSQDAAAGGPPVGLYVCQNYGSPFGQLRILSPGNYQLNSLAPATYTYDPSTRMIRFTSGTFQEAGWSGTGRWYPHGTNPTLNSDTLAIDEDGLRVQCFPTAS